MLIRILNNNAVLDRKIIRKRICLGTLDNSRVPSFCLLSLYWDSTGIVLGLYWDSIGTRLGLDWDSIGTVLGLYWDSIGDSIGTVVGQYWDSIGTVLGQYWDGSSDHLISVLKRTTYYWGLVCAGSDKPSV